MLHTVREGPDLWRRYSVRIGGEHGHVDVKIGPHVSTAGAPVPGSAPPDGASARVATGVTVEGAGAFETTVDVFFGPTIMFVPAESGIEVRFLNWHRRWSHSPFFAVVLGLAVTAAAAVAERFMGRAASGMPITMGLVAMVGVLGHVLGDQLGVMGSPLLYPFSKRRIRGLGLLHSGDALPNFLVVWTSVATILLNVDRLGGSPRLDPLRFAALGIGLPVLLLGGAYVVRRRGAASVGAQLRPPEVASEMADPDLG
jgi:membrane-bound metal-dependent hydrolase YbcI (DUF457 family)